MRFLIRSILRQIAKLLFRVRLQGDPAVFKADKLLIIANHESFLDGFLLGLFLPLDPVFVVNTGIARQWHFKLILSLADYLIRSHQADGDEKSHQAG